MSPLFGEFMGTLVLVLIGDAVVANVLLRKTLGEGAGWVVIVSGYALGVVAGVFTALACGSPGAHINPAVTLALAIASGDYSNVAPFFAAQTLGGVVGGVLVWLHFLPHWGLTDDPGKKLGVFATGPAVPNTPGNIISEIIGTFLLVLIIKSIVFTSPAAGLVPFLVGLAVWGIGSGIGGTTGFAINPARDLGPRIAHAMLPIPGKGSSNFGYGFTVPVAGGLIGGALAGVFFTLTGI